MDLTDIENALEGLRKGLNSDGADLVVEGVSDERVEVSLVLGDNACKECIVNKDIMLALVQTALYKVLPLKPMVVLNDPRDGKKRAMDSQ